MHILPSRKLIDEFMIYAFDLPVMIITAIIVLACIVSVILWAIGNEYYQVPM